MGNKDLKLLKKMDEEIKNKNTNKKIINKESLAETCKRFDKETKAKKQELSKKKWEQRKKTYNKWSKRVNAVLDWIEGTPPKKTYRNQNKPRQKQYVIGNGIAYPIARSKPKTHKKPVKKKKQTKDPFDFEIKW
jgi:hypothetical protein